MNKALKVRIYPDKKQEIQIAKTFGCSRFVYNHFLTTRIDAYRESGASLTYNMCSAMLTKLKKECEFLREVDSIALQQSLRHLDAAYKNFFEKRASFPKFRKKRNDRTYSTTCINDNIRIEGSTVILPKLGRVASKIHREIPSDWKLKSATVERTPTGKYFVSILFEYESQVSKAEPKNILGLDYSSPYLYIDSNGNEPDYEKPFHKYQDKLAVEQRKLSHMIEANIKGYDSKRHPIWKRPLSECKNLQKQKVKVAKVYEKIANCRRDALHKLSHELAEKYDVIAVEDLNMRAMSQGLNLGKATMDNGYGMFTTFLKYKLEDRGKQLVVIDKWYPSTKTCSCCGNTKPMRLSEKKYVCPTCGLIIDRDTNAAINIKEEAIRMLERA